MTISRRSTPLLALSVLVLFPSIISHAKHISSDAYGAREEPQELKSRSFEFVYHATINDVPVGTKRLNLWLPYATTDANQEISDLQISGLSQATVYTEPRFGNSILFASIDNPKRRSRLR